MHTRHSNKQLLRKTIRRILLSSAGLAVVAVPIQEASAQLEEIIVTARRYEESITDAPLAVAVLDSDFLRSTRTVDVQTILDNTPGATWNQFAKAQPAFSLRGINSGNFGNASLEPGVSIVSDGLPLTKAFMVTLPIYDQARIEVMRGPQGTSFGRNATVGLMHFVSARPTQETTADVDVSVGDPGYVAVQGHFNTALSDTVSGRIAYNISDWDGEIEDRDTGRPLQWRENQSLRGSLLIEPSDNFTAFLKAEYIHDDDGPIVRRGSESGPVPWLTGRFGGYTDGPDPFTADIDDGVPGEGVERDMLFLSGEFTWAFNNGLSLTSLTGLQDGEHESRQDAFGTPFALRDQFVNNDATVFSTEIRLDNYGTDNRVRWIVGAQFLQDEEDRLETNVGFPERGVCGGQPQGACPEWTLVTDATGETDSFGVFGELSFDLSDQLELTIGGRFTDDTRDYRFSTFGWGEANGLNALGLGEGARDCNANRIPDPLGRANQNPAPGIANICGTEAAPMGFDANTSNSWDNFSGRLSLSYALSDSSTLYALYSEGFKAGGFQQDARNRPHLFDNLIDSEEMENIELGWKGSYDRAIFAVTLFDMQLKNAQNTINIPAGVGSSGNVTLVRNTGGVNSTGIEVEGTFAVTDNFTVGGNMAFYDAEFAAGSLQGGAFDPLTGTFSGEDISGTVPSNVPEQTYYLFGQYNWDLSNGASISLRADLRHRDTVWAQAGARNRDGLNLNGTGPAYLRPELDKIGINVSWTNPADTLEVSLWGRNLDDDPDFQNFGPGIGFIFSSGASGPLGLGGVPARPTNSTGRAFYGASVRWRMGG